MKPEKKRQKLSVKFAVTCILPASLLLVAVCCMSIMFTSKNLINTMKKSMDGQGTSKVGTVIDNAMAAANAPVFPKRAGEITGAVRSGNIDAVSAILEGAKNATPFFNDVYMIDFTSKKQYNIDGVCDFRDDVPYWYDEQRFESGKAYYKSDDINFDPNKSLLTYVYPFSLSGSDKPDACFVGRLENKSLLRTLELMVTVKESKWMLVSDDYRIIYHSLGYNEDVFENVESLISTHDPKLFTQNFFGRKVVLFSQNMEPLDNIMLVYVVPVDGIIKSSITTILLMAVLSLISIGIIIFFIRFMTRKIVKEINDIRTSLQGILQKKFTGKIENTTQDEMGDLVDDFNKVIDVLTYQAEHDDNTGFYNAKAFAEKSHDIINSENRRKHYAVIRVDIDNFSFINDIFDWEVGNSILVKIANILNAVFDGDSIHGYLGNDIFVVLFGYEERDEMLTKILKASDSIKECESRIHLVPHFGISDDVRNDADISVVCDHAGVALKTIKGSLLEVYAVYDEKFKEKHNTQKFVESNKQNALDNKEFYILLQPKCDIETGKVVGAEALVRWKVTETNEIIAPIKFIPIFEKNGFIIPLDKYVWEETCKVIKSWQERGLREIPVSVNVSRMHIYNPGFAKGLEALVRKYGIRPDLLEIEITESALLENGEGDLETVMNDLKSRGFRLLMDDFASGYSSLLSLQKLPFDVIKIDKALIDHVEEQENQKFVAGTVSFLFDLEKDIVVEGVETDSQKEILKNAGCRVVQGYCFSKPLAVKDFEKMAFGIEDTE